MAEQVKHRGYKVIHAPMAGAFAAQVYRGTTMVTRERFTGATSLEVIERAQAWIDAEVAAKIGRRRIVRPGTPYETEVGSVEEYAEFFGSEKVSETDWAMLVGHATAPERTMTAGAIARAAGWDSYSLANSNYGKLGRRVAEGLSLRLPRHGDGSAIWTCALADAADEDWTGSLRAGEFRWHMHSEVAEALRQCNALGRASGASVAQRR